MLSFKLHTRIGEQDLLLPYRATSSFTTVAGQAGWRGGSPSLDATLRLAAAPDRGNAYAHQFVDFSSHWLGNRLTERLQAAGTLSVSHPCMPFATSPT
jgi:hypothetical protein